MAQKAFEEGKSHEEFSGSFASYLMMVYHKQETATNMRVYAGHLFLFAGDILVTAWPVPSQYRRAAGCG